jgi:CYTH domain-containing protein
MAGGTHAFDMIKTLKNNENLKRLSYFKARQTIVKTLKEKSIDIRTATKEDMMQIRNQIIEERRKEIKKSIIALTISLLIVAALLTLIIKYLRF